MKTILKMALAGCIIITAACKNETVTSSANEIALAEVVADTTESVPALPAMPEFHYEIGSRFKMTLTKTEVAKLTGFEDLIGEEHKNRIVIYKNLSVTVMGDARWQDQEIDVKGTQGLFTPAQLELLQASDYGTDLLIVANYSERWSEDGKPEPGGWTPYITVVPDTQATYLDGMEALMAHLKENSQYYTLGVDQKVLRSARLRFTVSKEGKVINVTLDQSSGYKEIDWVMMDLIKDLPQDWNPAQNEKGEAIDQELVFSFGAMGC